MSYDWISNWRMKGGKHSDDRPKCYDMEMQGYFSMPNPPDDEVCLGKIEGKAHSDGSRPAGVKFKKDDVSD